MAIRFTSQPRSEYWALVLWQLPGLPAANVLDALSHLWNGKNMLKHSWQISANWKEKGEMKYIDVKLARVACRPARVGSALLSLRRISQISLKSSVSTGDLRWDVSGFESWTNCEICSQQKTTEEGCVVYSTLDSMQDKGTYRSGSL